MQTSLRRKAYVEDQQVDFELLWLNRKGVDRMSLLLAPSCLSQGFTGGPVHLGNHRTSHSSLFDIEEMKVQ